MRSAHSGLEHIKQLRIRSYAVSEGALLIIRRARVLRPQLPAYRSRHACKLPHMLIIAPDGSLPTPSLAASDAPDQHRSAGATFGKP
jgi:hypothetical protein